MNTIRQLVAIVTGASSGIGLAVTQALLERGWRVVGTSRTISGSKELTPSSDLVLVDGNQPPLRLMATGAFAEEDPVMLSEMLQVNMGALTQLTRMFLPAMVERGSGRILNVASLAAFQPGPLMAVYYASKAFVLSFSEALWREAEGTGVHVSCLCPGPTASNFRERAGTGKTRLSKLGTPMSSMSVARQGYRAFQNNRRVMITGWRNRMTASLAPFLPRKTLLNTVYGIQSPA